MDLQAGASFTVCITEDSKLLAWGGNELGQLGVGDVAPRRLPSVLTLPIVPRAVACGTNHVLVVSDQGRLWGWGANESSQINRRKDVAAVLRPVEIDLSGIGSQVRLLLPISRFIFFEFS